MGSQRTTVRSNNGNDIGGSGRSSNCSYLSNVRPENRSTLCSVMAQLTEETQPFFETTLKSKAVSENSTVKFSCVITGHPTPQITWYKDDKQLDRYCGLPKYEIFRNGQSHSLHIYNCTVEDAAIYQASAINTKGIVSCSGVLEVGEMNEFKIHERYFAKLKQKVENKCREAPDKENQEYLRTISPDRTQRKRRSTTEARGFLGESSPMEDEENKESVQAENPEAEFRLQEATVEKPDKNTAPVTDGAVCATTSGHGNNDKDNRSRTMYDPAQNIFTSHQPKSPFVKKKIKISNSAKAPKADIVVERMSRERTKDETSSSLTHASTEAVHANGISEVMEVENNIHLPFLHLDSKFKKENDKKSATEKAALNKSSSKNENPRDQATAFSKRLHLTKTVSPVAASSNHTLSENERKKKEKQENKGGHRDPEKHLETKKLISRVTSTQKQLSLKSTDLNMLKKVVHATERATTTDTNRKSKPASDKCLELRESTDKSRDSRTALPQCPCEVAESLLSEKETSSRQESESVSQPDVPCEVTHADMTRNDAPVRFEPPPDQGTISSQPPQNADDTQTFPLCSGLQAKTEKTAQDTLDKSRKSNESCSVVFTHQKKFLFDTHGATENIPGCNVSPATQQSQADKAIKAVERTEIQDVKKVDGNKVDKLAPSEKILEMETEAPGLQKTEQIKTAKTNDAGNKGSSVVTKNPSYLGNNEKQPISSLVEKTSSESQKLESDVFETPLPDQTQTSENVNSLESITDSQNHPKAEPKVISIAELLRSQIKALDLVQANSDFSLPAHANLAQGLTIAATGGSQEVRDDNIKCNGEANIFKPDNETEKSTSSKPPTNLKATLMEIYQQLNGKEEQVAASDVTSTPAQPLNELPVSFSSTGTSITELHGRNSDDAVKDISLVSDSSSKDSNDTPLSLTFKDGFPETLQSVLKQPETFIQKSGPPVRETHIKASIQETNSTILEHTKDETVQGPNVELLQTQIPPKNLNSKVERGLKEENVTLSDQLKVEEHDTKTTFTARLQTNCSERNSRPAKKENDTQLVQQESSEIKESLRSDPTPEPSPLIRRKNGISPISSATSQELASGARSKLSTPLAKPEEVEDNQTQTNDKSAKSTKISTSTASPSLSRRSSHLQSVGEQSPVTERRSPLVSRRKTVSEAQTLNQVLTEQIQTEGKSAEKDRHNPFKAPQVIRKIRAETFADASGQLKLWCQFFNILSDSIIKWYRNEEEIVQVKRNAGDETPVNLTVVQASSKDSGVYGCSITNEYGTDSTDFLLSAEILAGMSLREDLGVGEEIEMTPLIFSKGLADSGTWRNKFFGRIMMTESHIGDGCSHKVWRAKVIYGLEPVFESSDTCIIKVRNPITYGGKEESCLIERNLDIMKKECKIQNLAREYCKVFSAEARVIENFGSSLEVIPVYLMYRPANTVPYATVETDLGGVYKKYSVLDHTGKIISSPGSEAEQKCSTLQHWIFQWTNGNLLLTRLEGVDTKLTNVEISVKSTGHQGLSVEGNPKVFELFVSQHKCNYFCGLLGLKPLKVMDSLMTPTKPKSSRSPLLQRKKMTSPSSPQPGRKTAVSPRLPRKAEQEGDNTHTAEKTEDASKIGNMV
ncbi:alpha-protein kinase 3 isoform X2 [Kryptolebias marmoratus]|uniref:non-specific serine/threonine protein kinase n=2 Tax=Kryptolebias marmoratus TaxID=37003 RepID=A0A3Q3GK57_KRYMA|nr:alpha-protein kinase 3 isoform X2 [Kryptolebias marmoratus]